MNCLNCNAPLSGINYCTTCGADMSILKRIERISNMNYNEGLDKASIRDLSGAIVCLKRSLKFNKYNIEARNLLGLVYFETGEVVSALSEWVISKNLQNDNNIADEYITELQSNPNRLDTINQTIKKYNQALLYCQQGNEDMAVIQLKKLLNQNPKLIKGHQLLALLYINGKQYEKARRTLKRAARIDKTSTKTLRYINEVDDATGIKTRLEERRGRRKEKGNGEDAPERIRYTNGNETIIQPVSFQETSIAATFINLILGLVVGAALIWFLIVPGQTQRIYRDANKEVNEFGEKVAEYTAKIGSLESELARNQRQIEEANKTAEDAQNKVSDYEDLNKMVAASYAEDLETTADYALSIDPELLDDTAKQVFEGCYNDAVKEVIFQRYYNSGESKYVAQNYQEAIEDLLKALEQRKEEESASATTVKAMEFIAYSYNSLGDKKNSAEWFNKLIEANPGSAYVYQEFLQ